MKITKIFSASLLAGAVLISASGCASSEVKDVGTETLVASAPASPTNSSIDISPTTDIDGILRTINSYYYYISKPDSSDRLKEAEAVISDRPASDEAINKFAEDFSEGFKYFDTSTRSKTNDAYKALMIGTSAGKLNEGLKMTIPADSVTINGNTAKINTTYIKVTMNGEKKRVAPDENPDEKDIVTMVKNDSGLWVIVAKASSVDPSSP